MLDRFAEMTSDSEARQHFPEGHILGPFEIQRQLASGEFADLYTARYRDLEREVALRIFHTSETGHWAPETAKAICLLRHPNIVSIHFAGHIDDRLVLAMDYVEGRTLREILREEGRLQLAEVLRICSCVTSALECAHSFSAGGSPNLAHLCLRPSKVFLDSDGTVRVSGFGVVQAAGLQDSRTGGLGCSPPYMAPEQFDGIQSPQSDLWAVGILLFEMLMGKSPYQEDSLEKYRVRICEQKMEIVPEFVQLPEPILGIILRCLQRNPSDRIASAVKLASELALVGAVLGLRKCPTCGADIPPGSDACVECSVSDLRESYSRQWKRFPGRARKGRSSSRIYWLLTWILLGAGALFIGGFLLWQSGQQAPIAVQKAEEPSPPKPLSPSSERNAKGASGDVQDGTSRNRSGEKLHISPAFAKESNNVPAPEIPRGGSYEDQISRFSRFVERHPGTAESVQAEEKLRIWEAESYAFRNAEKFERDPTSRICAILARWRDFDARQTTGLRHIYAQERIRHWDQQVKDYIGYAELTVQSAQGLLLADSALLGSGKPDPYFELLEGSKVIYRSWIFDDNSSPVWNEKVRIYIWQGQVLNLEIWDDNFIGRDLLVRQPLLPLPVDGPYQIRNGNILMTLEIQRER